MKTYKELMTEKFNFKAAVTLGMLEKSDEKYVKDLEKKKWKIEEFNLTSSGYEIWISKSGKKVKYTDKISPSKALELASKKAK
tara:strand:- start:601 stop:849 length:249 start_codon:yes stop_codon:yes gene_type:complete